MTEQLEQRIRRAVRDVDSAPVGPSDEVLRRTGSRVRARERNRMFARGGATVGIVALAVAGVTAMSGRDAPPDRSGTGAVPTVVAPQSPLPRATIPPTAPPTTPPPTTPPPTTTPAEESRWRPIAAHPEGIGWDLAAAWMDDEAFVLGSRAYSYDPTRDAWRALAPVPERWTDLDDCQDAPATCIGDGIGDDPTGFGFVDPIVVWTGEKVLVVGGDQPVPEGGDPPPDCVGGCRYPNLAKSANLGYVPATDEWQLLAGPPWFVNARSPHAWTGTELFVWPWDVDDNPDPAYAYDPATNTWRQLPDVPIAPRQNAASVWTGSEWIVWGGGDDSREFADGAAYDPTTDTWRVLAESPISARKTQAAWTGAEMLMMAGSQGGGTAVCCGNYALTDGAAYDPATDSWRSLAGTVGHPGFEPLWAGDVLLMFAKGGAVVYDPASEEYVDVCCEGLAGSTHVWTGTEAISFGSYADDRGGGIFSPP